LRLSVADFARDGHGLVGAAPDGQQAAVIAITGQAAVNGANVVLVFATGQLNQIFAAATFEDEGSRPFLPRRRRGKFYMPKIDAVVGKGYAVGMQAALLTDLADDAHLRFAVRILGTQDEFLLGNEAMAGDDAGAMETDDDSIGALGKGTTFVVVADNENGKFERQTRAATLLAPGDGSRKRGGIGHALGLLGEGAKLGSEAMVTRRFSAEETFAGAVALSATGARTTGASVRCV
jgi:hypothetical protein